MTIDWAPVLDVLGAVGLALLVIWLVLLALLWRVRPSREVLSESVRLVPDLARLTKRLLADPTLPTGVRSRVVFLAMYLAVPFDLVPDFIPVLGQADDVLVAILVLRSIVRRAGADAIRRHWPGTELGLTALWKAAGLPGSP